MKKSCICLLIVCALLLFSVPPAALAAYCEDPIFGGQQDNMAFDSAGHEHQYGYYEGQKPYLERCESNGGITHSLYKYYTGICIHCAMAGNVAAIGAPENHVFEYSGLNQHVKGENRHQYFYACNACKEVVFDIYLCPGTGNGDCILIVPGANQELTAEVE